MTPIMSIAGLGGPTPSFAKGASASFTTSYYQHGAQSGGWRVYWADGDLSLIHI